ncbi:LytTR family DNA-binding domain-containing protein [Dokdonia sp. Hel_I_53]|uniref:LytTR family DNA-binding domain-containing protein n=1 Tax=Dokdonia sp. Hel_I_53 TaxID=1566287 RepID=UPI00119C38A0|nr:LytTR family DNA-binding domain-containing protein [Dokdonia sp. Hel_I_53]TVZ51625.1 LytTR family transcriptional regulator [Dokdonia sp. Hel_I_53]
MLQKFPLDPKIKSHLFIAIGLAFWVFSFLFFTEPLDVNELSSSEKLIYLPLYGILAALCYLAMLPVQQFIFIKNNQKWQIRSEFIFFLLFIAFTFIIMRLFYSYIIVYNQPNPYSISYYFTAIFFPAMLVIFPIVAVARYAFGKYVNRRIEASKIHIKGEGNYEGLRLFPSDLILLEASDNYVEIHYQDHGNLKKQLIRTRLSKLEKKFPELIRTHRSFLINSDHFQSYKMEKNKMGLILSHTLFVPVSKTRAFEVKKALSFATN